MENIVIVIPSYKRPLILNSQTLTTLNKCGIKKELINIFIIEEEYNQYESILNKEFYNKLIIGKKGLVPQREFIENYYDDGIRIVSFDDDIKEIDLTLSHHNTLIDFINSCFIKCNENNSFIWGVYPVFNQFFRLKKEYMSTELKYIIGAWYGFINRKNIIKLDITINGQKEDVERTIKYFLNDGIVLRFNTVGFKTKYYGNDGGGLGTFNDRLLLANQNSIQLVNKYNFITSIKDRTNGMKEVILKKIKSYQPHIPIHLPSIDNNIFHLLETLRFTNKGLLYGRQRGLGIKESMMFGIIKARVSRTYGLSMMSKKYPEVYNALKKLGDSIVPFNWNGIQINKNGVCNPHKDKNNIGLSLIVSVGNFTGGELIINDIEYDTYLKPLLFDGKNNIHYNNKIISGTKYSITFFMA
jgi:hypothetical protein